MKKNGFINDLASNGGGASHARPNRLEAFWLFDRAWIQNAMLRYRLVDINLLINRTLVYIALTAIIVGIYALLVGYLGWGDQSRDKRTSSIIPFLFCQALRST